MRKGLQLAAVLLLILCLLCGTAAAGDAERIKSGPWWTYRLLEDGTAEMVRYEGIAVHEVIPEAIDGKTVTALSGQLITEWTQSVEIPATVKRITGNPFAYGSKNLKEIILPEGQDAFRLEKGLLISNEDQRLICALDPAAKGKVVLPEGICGIERNAFYNKQALTSVTIPASTVSIPGNPFGYCGKLKEVKIAEGNPALTMEDGILMNRSEGTLIMAMPEQVSGEITVPDGFTTICGFAFNNCKKITAVRIPDSVTAIGEKAFRYSGIREIELPEGLTAVADHMFDGCGELQEIRIPERVVSLGDGAFESCFGLQKIELSPSLKEIGDLCFGNCVMLEEISLPDGLEKIGRMVFMEAGLTRLALPDTVVSIGEYCCQGCLNLASVKLSGGLKEIPAGAFAYCEQLRNVNGFPKELVSIGESAFGGDIIENEITIPETVEYIGRMAFSYVNLVLPAGEIELEDKALGEGLHYVVPGSWCHEYCKAFGLQMEERKGAQP